MVSERVPTVSTLAPDDLVGRPAESVLDVITGAPVARVALYGFGKAALRDGLAAQEYERGAAVLLPALVPDGVVEPIRELGLEPRFYDVHVDADGDTDLTPSLSDVEAVAEEGEAALVAVHYFGFPNPRFSELLALAEENGVDLVSDNAHGALSRVDGRLLGTRGALGITSLRKLLPIPDGAALYLNREGAYDRVRSPYAGVADGYRRAEATFVAKSLAMGVRDRHPTAVGALRRVGSGGVSGVAVTNGATRGNGANGTGERCGATSERDPEAIYRGAKRPMSRLSARVCARIDPHEVVAERRATFRAWIDRLEDVPGVEPVYRRLPDGACPQACPVIAETAERATEIVDVTPGTHTWPPLPRAVADSATFPGAVDVAARLVPLPCHRTVDETAIRRAVSRFR